MAIKEIFTKAKNEIQKLLAEEERDTIEKVLKKFDSLTESLLMGQFKPKEGLPKLSLDDLKESSFTNSIYSFFFKEVYLYKNKDIWLHFIVKTAKFKCPFVSFSFLIAADIIFEKNFLDYLEMDDHVKFLIQLQLKSSEVSSNLRLYKECLDFFPLKDESISNTLQNLSQKIHSLLSNDDDSSTDSVLPSRDKADFEKKEHTFDNDRNIDLRMLFFNNLLTDDLKQIYKNIINDKDNETIHEQIESLQKSSSWRDLFIKNLLLLHWKLNIHELEESKWLVKGLWQIAYLLGARDKKDLNFEEPYNNILALWDPELYIALIKLTHKLFSLDPEVKIEIKAQNILDKENFDKLSHHQFILGIYETNN